MNSHFISVEGGNLQLKSSSDVNNKYCNRNNNKNLPTLRGVTKTKTYKDPVFVFLLRKRRPPVLVFVLQKRRPCKTENRRNNNYKLNTHKAATTLSNIIRHYTSRVSSHYYTARTTGPCCLLCFAMRAILERFLG